LTEEIPDEDIVFFLKIFFEKFEIKQLRHYND